MEESNIDKIISEIKSEIKSLISKKKSGNFKITIELEMNQGGIRDKFLCLNSRERK